VSGFSNERGTPAVSGIGSTGESPDGRERVVSVVIPAHNDGKTIEATVRAVLAQAPAGTDLEVIVVDDGSTDDTRAAAERAGARVLQRSGVGAGGNPAAARNLGARKSRGDPIIFLDSDCTPLAGWLDALLAAHDRGEVIVGGALDLPPGLPWSARCDYYCGWYLIHSARPGERVAHQPPPNLSVRRRAFLSTAGFTERQPFSYTNEERHWQAELRRRGHDVWFEPEAAVHHWNRPGFANLLRRNYRWAYTAVEAKHVTRSARMAWLYRYPWLVVLLSVPLALAHTLFIVACWVRAGRLEPIVMMPAILVSRMAYAAGMSIGGLRWLRTRASGGSAGAEIAPRWG
jgi:glycosyltransferase involved in cell wall biosynthesis